MYRTKYHAYNSWKSMIARCRNKKDSFYHRYGGRGITVCNRWLTFENFLEDMGERPKGTTIERRKNDLGYFLENCRWATRREQARNRSDCAIFTVKGKTGCISELAEVFGISPLTAAWRLNVGKSPEEAFCKKTLQFLTAEEQQRIISMSKSKTVNEIASLFDAKPGTIYNVIWRHNRAKSS